MKLTEWAGDNKVGAPPPWETQAHRTHTHESGTHRKTNQQQ